MRSAAEPESDMKALKKVGKIILIVAATLSTLQMIVTARHIPLLFRSLYNR